LLLYRIFAQLGENTIQEHTQNMDLLPFAGYFSPQAKNNLQKKKSTIGK